ncbi:MAG: hypothetical protein MZV63_26035 [Marinilabiliales bacterium]|nr:hypothetical protein [Marinilabiliales bacterium]
MEVRERRGPPPNPAEHSQLIAPLHRTDIPLQPDLPDLHPGIPGRADGRHDLAAFPWACFPTEGLSPPGIGHVRRIRRADRPSGHSPDDPAAVKRLGLRAEITTNGTLLDGPMIEGLRQAGLDILWASFDSAGEKGFEDIRPGAKFGPIVAALREIQAGNARKRTSDRNRLVVCRHAPQRRRSPKPWTIWPARSGRKKSWSATSCLTRRRWKRRCSARLDVVDRNFFVGRQDRNLASGNGRHAGHPGYDPPASPGL